MIDSETIAEGADGAGWYSHEDFVCDDLPGGGPCPKVIDITGRARVIFRGPGVTVGPGLWRATVHFELCQDAARRFLALDFGVAPDFAIIDLPRGVVGPQRVMMDRSIAFAAPLQLSLRLRKPAFHGYVRFTGATLQRLAAPDV